MDVIDWARNIPVHDLSDGRGLCRVIFAEDFLNALKDLPSAQPEIIRCKDCRWWDKYGNYDNGYCMAAKHGYLSEHWKINIRRTYKGDFYCADAEPNYGVSMQDDFSEHMNPPTT